MFKDALFLLTEYKEYFIKGTEPTEYCDRHSKSGKIIINR